MKIANVTQGSDEWKAWRSQGVTASDAVALMGYDDRTWWHLWAEKSGLVDPPDLDRNPHVRRGHRLEDPARRRLEARLGCVLLPICGEHDDAPYIRASFDGLDDDNRPTELKAPGESVAQELEADGEQSVPYRRYWVQVQYQILVAGADRGYLAFYNERFGGDGLLVYLIDPDPAFQAELQDRAHRLIALLNGGQAPAKDPERDPFQPTAANDVRWQELAARYGRLEERAKALKGELNIIQQQQRELASDCREMMGAFRKADAYGLKVSRSTYRGNVDYARLLADQGIDSDTVERYRKASSERTTITVDFDRVPAAAEPTGEALSVVSHSDAETGETPTEGEPRIVETDYYF